METASPSRAQLDLDPKARRPARAGFAELDGRRFEIDAEALVDESAGYHERHTRWQLVGRA